MGGKKEVKYKRTEGDGQIVMGEEKKRWGRRSWRQSEVTETQSWHTLSCRLFYWVIEWELAWYGNSVCVFVYVLLCRLKCHHFPTTDMYLLLITPENSVKWDTVTIFRECFHMMGKKLQLSSHTGLCSQQSVLPAKSCLLVWKWCLDATSNMLNTTHRSR